MPSAAPDKWSNKPQASNAARLGDWSDQHGFWDSTHEGSHHKQQQPQDWDSKAGRHAGPHNHHDSQPWTADDEWYGQQQYSDVASAAGRDEPGPSPSQPSQPKDPTSASARGSGENAQDMRQSATVTPSASDAQVRDNSVDLENVEAEDLTDMLAALIEDAKDLQERKANGSAPGADRMARWQDLANLMKRHMQEDKDQGVQFSHIRKQAAFALGLF